MTVNNRPGLQEIVTNHEKYNSLDYLNATKRFYGSSKVENVCHRYQLFQNQTTPKPLNINEIKQLQQGLYDIHRNDLDLFIEKFVNDEPLSARERNVLRELKIEEKCDIQGQKSSSTLKVKTFNMLVDLFKKPNESYKDLCFANPLLLENITGLPHKYIHGWINHSVGRSTEDQERLRLYEELANWPEGEYDGYCEVVAKILVKKHLYYEQKNSNELGLGMLIPAPLGPNGEKRWYRVDQILDTGWGKLAYRLVPATSHYAADMPELIVYRSSATLPSALDACTSYLQDFNIRPPGYLSKGCSSKEEMKWYMEPSCTADGKMRTLMITGHSLGGAHAQLALKQLQETNQWIDRPIAVKLFDSTTIYEKDARDFAQWYNGKQTTESLTFDYYVSHNDPVPLAGAITGSSYLGNGLPRGCVDRYAHVHQLKPTGVGLKDKLLTGIGPHNRLYFRGIQGIDYTDNEISIAAYDQSKRYLRVVVNIARAVSACFVWPTIGLAGITSRFLFGRRHHASGISQLWSRIFSQAPKQTIQLSETNTQFSEATAH